MKPNAFDWPYKLYAILSEEAVKAMGGNRGKMCNQSGHGFLEAHWDAEARFPEHAAGYRAMLGHAKFSLIAPLETLKALEQHYKPLCGCYMVTDAAHTVFKEPTITCLGLLVPKALIGENLSSLKGFL